MVVLNILPLVGEDIRENRSLRNIQIAPNPIQDGYFTLTFFENIQTGIPLRLYDSIGNLVQEKVLFETENTIGVRSLPKGIYFLNVNLNGDQNIKKIVIQ